MDKKPTREVLDLLKKMDDKKLEAINAINKSPEIWESLNKLLDALMSREEFYGLQEVKPYGSMDDMIKGSTKQVQRQGKLLGYKMIQDLIFHAPTEVERRENKQ